MRHGPGHMKKNPPGKASTGQGGNSLPEKSVGYPDVPGPTQPRDRSLGYSKVKNCPDKKGL